MVTCSSQWAVTGGQSCGEQCHVCFPKNKPSGLEKCPGSRSLGGAKSKLVVFVAIVRKLTSSDRVKGLPRGLSCKESACNAGDMGLIPGSGGSPGEGNGNPLQLDTTELSGFTFTFTFLAQGS